MKILKTLVGLDSGGGLYHMETIEHQGKMWLVPGWLEAPSEGWKIPARIICLDPLPHQKLPQGDPYGDFVLNGPLHKSVCDGHTQLTAGYAYVVIERPDIRIPIPRGIH